MPSIRPPAVAGSFYSADPHLLAAEVDGYLAAGRDDGGAAPKAVVAPHAGYVYSGPVAGSAFRALGPRVGTIQRVVLLGPSHFVPLRGLALPTADAFRTPLGDVPLDRGAGAALAGLAQIELANRPHAREHSLEVELPFLQRLLGRFELVPLVVGDAEPEEVARALDRLWGGEETAIVVSTDLSHYLDAASARRKDAATAAAVVELDATRIADDDACGASPLRGLLVAARARGLAARTLDLRNSGDTAGPADRVVGYGAFAFA
ncbi:MAG TPA: AmmeMemoRadiSam system protein B [Thermoanaerobaculia bacterium]|nr:AmmeMemoRadiSam system protein B [Thermoanaerobaculia bacterium]